MVFIPDLICRLQKTITDLELLYLIRNWGAAKAIGPISATAPSGYYFHEDGETISELVIEANEGVDIIGVGEGNSFKGWCVLNRFRYGVANSGEGFPLKAIFAGKVEFSGGVPRITKQKRYNQYWYEPKIKNVNYRI